MMAYILTTYCDVYTDVKAYDSAIYFGEAAMAGGRQEGAVELQAHYAGVLSRLYESAGKPLRALYYHKAADSLSVVLNNKQQALDQALQVTRIDMEGQAARNRVENAALLRARKNGEVALVAALIAILALAGLSIFIYRSLRQKQQANRTISMQAASLKEQNAVIDAALKAKETMLKETHHRIKNNLQLISSLLELQVADIDNPGAKDALRTAQRRIQSIATVHSKLYGSGEDEAVELSAFVTDLFMRLRSAFGEADAAVHFENKIPATSLPLNTVVQLGLILNELITNSFKHAFAQTPTPVVRVDLARDADGYGLHYFDNGPGLPEGAFSAQTGSLGLYLVKRISKGLKGTAHYAYDGGSRFTVHFRDAGD